MRLLELHPRLLKELPGSGPVLIGDNANHRAREGGPQLAAGSPVARKESSGPIQAGVGMESRPRPRTEAKAAPGRIPNPALEGPKPSGHDLSGHRGAGIVESPTQDPRPMGESRRRSSETTWSAGHAHPCVPQENLVLSLSEVERTRDDGGQKTGAQHGGDLRNLVSPADHLAHWKPRRVRVSPTWWTTSCPRSQSGSGFSRPPVPCAFT